MPKGRIWDFFHEGEMQTKSHHKAYCLCCIETHQPDPMATDAIDVVTKQWLEVHPWFKAGVVLQLKVKALS
ncbi:hypothetical protein B0H13DRAFT_1626448 [Mycena leptocephala]|nr:hypothetical protein B0H13DRAFT_1626448 [Mycena leptocephala]